MNDIAKNFASILEIMEFDQVNILKYDVTFTAIFRRLIDFLMSLSVLNQNTPMICLRWGKIILQPLFVYCDKEKIKSIVGWTILYILFWLGEKSPPT